MRETTSTPERARGQGVLGGRATGEGWAPRAEGAKKGLAGMMVVERFGFYGAGRLALFFALWSSFRLYF